MKRNRRRMVRKASQETSIRRRSVPDYGTIVTIKFGPQGIDGACVIHPDDLDQLRDVNTNNTEVFTDDQNITWVVSEPEEGRLHFDSRGLHGLNGDVDKNELLTNAPKMAKRAFIKGYVPHMSELHKIGKNLFECKSTKDFWKVSEDGKIVRLTSSTEVDNGEHLEPAPHDDPEGFLKNALVELSLA